MLKIFSFFILIMLISCVPPRMAYLPDYQEKPNLESSVFGSDQGLISEKEKNNQLK